MTLEEIRASDRPFLHAADIADIMRSDPQAIRDSARRHPEWLHFPTVCVGNRVKIPREPFLAYWEGKS